MENTEIKETEHTVKLTESEPAEVSAPAAEETVAASASSAESEKTGITPERKMQYDRFRIGQAVAIAIGVVLCILSVFAYPYYAAFFKESGNELENFVFGVMVAAAVFLFVWAGTGGIRFYDITRPEALRTGVSGERMAAYRKFLSARRVWIALAVGMFVAAPFTYMFYFSMLIMAALISVGVAILIIVGAVHGTYSDVRKEK